MRKRLCAVAIPEHFLDGVEAIVSGSDAESLERLGPRQCGKGRLVPVPSGSLSTIRLRFGGENARNAVPFLNNALSHQNRRSLKRSFTS